MPSSGVLRAGHDVEERITALARRQFGVVTRAQLLDLGLPSGAVQRRTASCRLRRLHHGIYLVGPIMPPRAREMAAVLACGRMAVASHRSAASLWGLTSPRDESQPVDVTVPGGRNKGRNGIRVHGRGRLNPHERTKLDGIPVTAPARTLVDLASVVEACELERAIAKAERERLVGRTELSILPDLYRKRPGMPVLRGLLAARHGPALTRSEAETNFLSLVRRARLPEPEANVVIDRFEVDFLWRAEGVAVEIDGYRFHSSRPRFESDRRRIAHLAARGIQVVPLTWSQIVHDGVATAVLLGQILLRAEGDRRRRRRAGGVGDVGGVAEERTQRRRQHRQRAGMKLPSGVGGERA